MRAERGHESPEKSSSTPPETARDVPEEAARVEGRMLRERVQQVTSIRFDKVERICREIANGDYRSDSRAIAERILSAMKDEAEDAV